MIFYHGIQYDEEFPHAGGKGYFMELPCGTETFVEGFYDKIKTDRIESAHV